MSLPKPPFGDQVAEILADPSLLKQYSGSSADGKRGTVYILTGPGAPGMHNGMPTHLTVIMPTETSPEYFSWGFLAAHCPVLVWADSMDNALVNAIWKALERDGCNSASFCDGEWMPVLKKTGSTA